MVNLGNSYNMSGMAAFEALSKKEGLTDRYQFVQTKLLAERFNSLGFTVDSVQKTKVRKGSNEGFQKHLVRMSNPSIISAHNDIKLQLVITNSHDGKSGLRIVLGFFRFVCSNGMVVGTRFEEVSIRHTGNMVEKIDYAVEKIVAQIKTLDQTISKLKGTVLSEAQVIDFQSKALKLRGEEYTGIDWTTRRQEDSGTGLFEVLNRVQEDLIRGKSTATRQVESIDNSGNVTLLTRSRAMRPIKNLNREVEINQKLFDLAMEYIAA